MLEGKLQTEKPTPRTVQRSYHLSLSDGNRWCFSADHRNTHVLENLARIMRLNQGSLNSSPNLIFCSKRSGKEKGANKNTHTYKPFRFWKHNDGQDLFCETSDNRGLEIQYLHMWYGLLPIYQQSSNIGGLAVHGALAELNGEGFLMVAPGGAGKSTCYRRFPNYWQPLCDDESLVVLDERKKYRAHPFPTWSNYLWKRSRMTWDVQHSVPLKGLFFLEKADNDTVESLGGGKAAGLLNASTNQVFEKYCRVMNKQNQRILRQMLFKSVCRMAKQIPSYRLRVSRHGRFWEKMEAATSNQGK